MKEKSDINEDFKNEIWKPIDGYDGVYEVSNMGRVKSDDRKVWNYTKKGRILKSCDNGHSYLYVRLTNGNREEKHAYIHRLVAQAFIPNPDNLPEVNHKNFDKKDNRAENLEWVTEDQNKKHYVKSKRIKIAMQKKSKTCVNRAFYNANKYKHDIIRMYKEGYTITAISHELNLGRDFVSDVIQLFKGICL